MKKVINFQRNENSTIGLIQSNLNKLSKQKLNQIKLKRLMNLTQNELDIINKYKKVS